ncbi:Large protein containing hemagglutination activity domain protein [Candidatus Magnetomorum sp. HK-1]|nr:Large protein containing hemagglutination activity domain protein [Candidatus Magnetomorum sp. HK-1]
MKKIDVLLIIFLIFHLIPVYANETHSTGIIIDGTIGSAGQLKLDLKDSNYDIKYDYGVQKGQNLFHSFEQFNLHKNEIATFSGPDNSIQNIPQIQNIISRVTGGKESWINGTIRSIIPNSNLYLLNPSGIMFGPDARLDIEGSFHASTADYLKFTDSNKFYSNGSVDSVLTMENPSAFGFLDDGNFASIEIEGKGEINNDLENKNSGLAVESGETISLIAGHIDFIKGTYFRETDKKNDFGYKTTIDIPISLLSAPSGQINLASVNSKGEIKLTKKGPVVSNFEKLGNISLYIIKNLL